MTSGNETNACIASLTQLLSDHQQPNGSFLSYSSPANAPSFLLNRPYQTVFINALILGAIAKVADPALVIVKKNLANYLLTQSSQSGSYNYWDRQSSEFTRLPYPDDFDDTACVLLALASYDARLITGQRLAQFVSLLVATERSAGGPYPTWITPGDDQRWSDVDIAVNANIAAFLQTQEVQLHAQRQLFQEALLTGLVRSPYYPNELPVLYFLARLERPELRARLRVRLAAQLRSRLAPKLLLPRALLALSSWHLDQRSAGQRLAAELLEGISRFGVRAEGFCLDPALNKTVYLAGAPALTAAFCLLALSGAGRLKRAESQKGANKINQSVTKCLAQVTSQLPSSIAQTITATQQKIIAADRTGEITGLPFWIRDDLPDSGVSAKVCALLAVANLYGWTAYGLLDQFLDDQRPAVSQLPAAITALRTLNNLFEQFNGSQIFKAEQSAILDSIDAANEDEVSNRRFNPGDIRPLWLRLPPLLTSWQIAAKSFGHFLSVLAVLDAAHYTARSKLAQSYRRFFTHYLAARQLSDDLHDWWEDLSTGQLTTVGIKLLARVPTAQRRVRLHSMKATLDQLFWQEVVVKVSQEINQELALARRQLDLCSLPNRAWTERLLSPIEAATARTLVTQQQTVEFLAAYRA